MFLNYLTFSRYRLFKVSAPRKWIAAVSRNTTKMSASDAKIIYGTLITVSFLSCCYFGTHFKIFLLEVLQAAREELQLSAAATYNIKYPQNCPILVLKDHSPA